MTGQDTGGDIAVDSAGQVYMGGSTTGAFPVTAGAYQTTFGGATDGFAVKLNAAGTALVALDPKDDPAKDRANPARPNPAANAVPDATAQKVEIDREIEDRFEATDN